MYCLFLVEMAGLEAGNYRFSGGLNKWTSLTMNLIFLKSRRLDNKLNEKIDQLNYNQIRDWKCL